MVMAAVISINTVAAPLGFLAAGQVLEHWGVVPLFAGVVLEVTWMAIVVARSSSGTATPKSRLPSLWRPDALRPPAL
jgi:hypothetical protein